MKNLSLFIIGILFFAGAVTMFLKQPAHRIPTDIIASQTKTAEILAKKQAKIGDTPINVEIADSDFARTQGLSGRLGLEPDSGMLFVFPALGKYGFWMKDMKFSLDIIWIGENGEIVAINKNLSPETYPVVYYPPSDVKYVLEVPANFSDTHNISVGNSFLLAN